jgi:hypothetical protein
MKDFSEIVAMLIWLMAFIILSMLVSQGLFPPRDDSDVADGNRSGLVIFRDALTGCEYLARPLIGTPTPRMNKDGKQVCR